MPGAPTEPSTALLAPGTLTETPAPPGAPSAPAPAIATGAPGIAGSGSGTGPGGMSRWQGSLRAHALVCWPALLIAGALCFVTFLAGGGLNLSDMTMVEIVLTLASGLIVAAVALFGPTRKHAYGSWAVGLLFAFAALTAASVVWSVQPDDSFRDAGRMFSYAAVFGASVALVRAVPARWPAVLGGVVLAAAIVCGYALSTKVFPASLDASDIYARLRAPYEYWNAIGLTAAMGAIGCMWLGARRTGHALLSALAYPAMGLMLLTLMLAYSRGALVALALGLVLWFCIVPLRLRGAAIMISGAVCAGAVVAWDFSRHALNSDNVELAARTSAGHQLGVLIVAMIVVLTLTGLAFGFWTGRNAPSLISRRRAGTLLLGLLVVFVLACAGALAASHRGFTGTISHALHSVTDPHAPVPSNGPGRLTAVGSVRARYWNEALKVFQAHPVLGAGAEGYATARLRYRTETLDVRHAHGYVVQTLADLGLVGLLVTLALLLIWMAAAGRATHPFNRRWNEWRAWRALLSRDSEGPNPGWRRLTTASGGPVRYTSERIGMLSMLCLVVVFGIHSLADWTWYVPGDACVALLCAGWLAGRGPIEASTSGGASPGIVRARGLRKRLVPSVLGPVRIAIAIAALGGALIAAWAQWQPQRSASASQQALSELAGNPRAALSSAQSAVWNDSLSAQALFTLSAVQQATGKPSLARATLQHAVRLQPSNPQTWLTLGRYDLASDPAAAERELAAAIYLNPELVSKEAIAQGNQEAIETQNAYVQALRSAGKPSLSDGRP